MRMIDAWEECAHGGSISRPSGVRVDKWMGDKPGLKPSFERWIDESIGTIKAEDLMGDDWRVDA